MTKSHKKTQAQATNETTKVSEPDVEQLQKTINRLKHENSQLKLKFNPNYPTDTKIISYVEDIVTKSKKPDIFFNDAVAAAATCTEKSEASSILSTYSINVDTCHHSFSLQIWVPESSRIFHRMWETMMKAGQRGVLLRPYRGSHDPSKKSKSLKPPSNSNHQVLSQILHETIEKPAARLVNAVEQKLGLHPDKTCVWYQDHVPEKIEREASKSFAESYPENAKLLVITSHTEPDACFFGYGGNKLLMAGVHFDSQSLNLDNYKKFEWFFQRYKGIGSDFKNLYKWVEKKKKEEKKKEEEEEEKSKDDTSLGQVVTIFNIILITYSLMVKYNLKYSYATSGQCWLIFYRFKKKNFEKLHYDFFFESKPYTEARKKCQSTDYQYLKETAFVKVVCFVLDTVIEYRKDDMDGTGVAAENGESNVSQESEDSRTNETNGGSSKSHRPVKKQKTTEHDEPSSDDVSVNNHHQPLPKYCTQKCLLGLKSNNTPMHKKCPNYSIHKKHSNSTLHPIQNTDLGILFYRQLENKRGGGGGFERIDDNNKSIYKITVYPYGYTFIGKGRRHSICRYLRHEISVYNKLETIQGEWVPVYLDYVRFSDHVRFDGLDHGDDDDEEEGPRIYLMMFLSYAGEPLEDEDESDVKKVGEKKIEKMKNRLLDLGIVADDEIYKKDNILWSKELGHEMLIDFDFFSFL